MIKSLIELRFNMSEKLLIAKYEDGLIKYSEYQESKHKGKLYCPFCNPTIRVTYNIKGFFMAWKNDGQHNCGKSREQVKYLDADWKGRKLTEISRDQEGDLEITIDINTLVYSRGKGTGGIENNIDGSNDKKEEYIFPVYKDRVEVFRDVVRSVYQMKSILEKNGQEFLKSLKFKFKTSDGLLTLNDVVIKMHELNHNIVGKSRFVIFMVNNSVLKGEAVYINAYSAMGINLTAKLKYPYNKNPFKKLEGEYAIAYGEITYSEKLKKYFLTLTNDFQIRKLKEDVGTEFFDDIEFEEYDYKTFIKPKENVEIIKENVNKDLENYELGSAIEIMNKAITNNNVRVESQDNHTQKSNLVNVNIDEPKHNNLSGTKIKQTEKIEQKDTYKKEKLPVEGLDIHSDRMLTKVKKFFRNLFGK